MTEATTVQHVDIGIVVALPEELRAFLDLCESYAPHPDDDLDAYLFTRGPYRCAVILVGEMGQTHAGVFTERLISTLDPTILVSIGIAGGVHDDLHVGDVHVPSQAVEYIQDAKASPAQGGGFAVVPGAPAYRASYALLKAVRSFEFTHRAQHEAWVAACGADLAVLLPDAHQREGLVTGKVVRRKAKLLADGHVATGPVVGAAPAFSAWLRSHDRNVKSLEMESAAVLLAAPTLGGAALDVSSPPRPSAAPHLSRASRRRAGPRGCWSSPSRTACTRCRSLQPPACQVRPQGQLHRWLGDALPSGCSTRLVEHLGDRRGDSGPLDPAFEAFRILLREDPRARCFRYGDAAAPEYGQQSTRLTPDLPVGARLLPRALHGHDELLLLRGPARLLPEHLLQS